MAEKKEKYSSIFDAASKLSKGKVPQKAAPEKNEEVVIPAAPVTDEELESAFERCKKLHQLIADTVDKAFAERQITPTALRNYFNKSQNFSSQQWQMIQAQKEELEKRLEDFVSKERAAEDRTQKTTSGEKKPKSMQVKSRWLPMR